MRLHELSSTERWILLALQSEPLHGYAIIKRVAELSRGDCELYTGTLYPAVERLLNESLIKRTDRVDADAPNRAYYRLTQSGRLRTGLGVPPPDRRP